MKFRLLFYWCKFSSYFWSNVRWDSSSGRWIGCGCNQCSWVSCPMWKRTVQILLETEISGSEVINPYINLLINSPYSWPCSICWKCAEPGEQLFFHLTLYLVQVLIIKASGSTCRLHSPHCPHLISSARVVPKARNLPRARRASFFPIIVCWSQSCQSQI